MDRLLKIVRFISLWFVLFGAWMLYTLDLHWESLVLGLGLSALTVLFSYHIFFDQQGVVESKFLYRWDLMLLYLLFLILQSYISSAVLIRQMLTGNYHSGVVRIKTRLQSRIGRTMLANTISLVPGTLSLWMEDNYIYVHWFDQKTRHRLKAGRIIKEPMEGILMKIFG